MNNDIPALTGLRGILSAWVVLFHVYSIGQILGLDYAEYLPASLMLFFNNGGLGVDGFFLLSGFVLAHVYSESMKERFAYVTARRFILLRLARIYPVHLTIILLYAVLKLSGVVFQVESCGAPTEGLATTATEPCDRFGLEGLFYQLTLTTSWLGRWESLTWNPPAWSISAEWAAYLCFPLLILVWNKLHNGLLALGLAFVSLGLMGLWMHHGGDAWKDVPIESNGLERIFPEFIAGMLIYRFYRSEYYTKLRWDIVGYLCLAGFVVAFLLQTYPLVVVVIFVPLILSLAQPNGLFSRILSTRFAVWFGHISFSLYMCHVPVMDILGALGGDVGSTEQSPMPWPIALGMLSGIIFLSIGFAAFLYHCVEEPSRRWLRRRIGGSRCTA